jgi:DNA invertase Pin-like site-specific DNA recombinase
MEKIIKAAKYLRISCSSDVSPHSDSIANQRRAIDSYLQKHPEIIVVAEKTDEGFSGVFFDRPAFREMIADIEAGCINCVIVRDLTRLGRNYIRLFRKQEKQGSNC